MAPKRCASETHHNRRQKKVKTLQEKIEILNMINKLQSIAAVARFYNLNESTIRSIKKKEADIRSAVAVANPVGAKTLHQLRDPYVSRTEHAAFLWMQNSYKKGIAADTSFTKEMGVLR
ncbi:CENP-B N-terminal DNA-binding domain [Popillia japonica]|uniref:CENP-B N-terminal DNA-binding domain n=1 Tax=Popillia japonica TaxID=7064 RepID=A0AAW1LUR1_POPJA